MMPAGSTTSMHSDFLAGKKTELETLTGYVIRQAEKLALMSLLIDLCITDCLFIPIRRKQKYHN